MASTSTLPAYKTLDSWRGIGCLAVLMFHGFRAVGGKYPSFTASRAGAVAEYGYLGVQLFFVISGYCIAHAALSNKLRNRSVVSFAKARVRRIFPPYWLCLPFFVILNWIGVRMRAQGTGAPGTSPYIDIFHERPITMISNLLLFQQPAHRPLLNGVAWTLCYEVAFYLLVAAALVVAAKSSARVLFGAMHLFTAGSLIAITLAPFRTVPFPFDMWPQFGLGVLAYDLLRRRKSRLHQLLGIVLVALSLLTIRKLVIADPIRWWAALPRGHEALDLAVSLGFAGIVVLLHPLDRLLLKNRAVSLLAWVGLFSYSIYLMHPVFQSVLSMGAKILHFPQGGPFPALLFLLVTAASIGGSWVFYVFCERPFTNLGTRPAKGPEELRAAAAAG